MGTDLSDEIFDAIIIGGGATGTGIARDLALRNIRVLLLEKNDLSEGTTGRSHGMLHSGARYVEKDLEAAKECAEETPIILKIAPHITEACGGYFIGITNEDRDYASKFETGCKAANIPFEPLSPVEFLKVEPNCNPDAQQVYHVNDAYVDPFLLSIYNAFDAVLHKAIVKTYCEVRNLLLTENEVVGVQYFDKPRKQLENAYAKVVVNASGPWTPILEKDLHLDSPLQIIPTQGTILVVNKRLTNSIINRLHSSANGDIVVPSHQTVLVGTSAYPAEVKNLDNLIATPDEIEDLLSLGEILIPSLRKHRVIRFFSGARPLISQRGSTRDISRKFMVIDYEKVGFPGFIAVCGGKVTTYRLMAEKVADLVCKKLNFEMKCSTALTPLPGGERPISVKEIQSRLHIDDRMAYDMSLKWGTFINNIEDLCNACLASTHSVGQPRVICECERVTLPELLWVRSNLHTQVLDDYRRRTRIGMGNCQGQFCYFKLADFEAQFGTKSHSQLIGELHDALEKRWKTEYLGDDLLKRQIKLSKYMYLLGGNLL